jgi:hypothetical protein
VPYLEIWKLAGYWRLYLELLAKQVGSLFYVPEPLNTHRRHEGGLTGRLEIAAHLQEIERLHGVAAGLLDLDAGTFAAQAEYRILLAQQFACEQKTTQPSVARRKKV